MNSAKGVAPFAYLDIVLDGVVNLAEDKFSRQELIVFSSFLHQITLHHQQLMSSTSHDIAWLYGLCKGENINVDTSINPEV